MNLRTHWRSPGAPLRWCLVFALMFTTMSALAQYDEMSDADRCDLGQSEYCPDPPKVKTTKKADKKEKVEEEIVSVKREFVVTCPTLPPSIAVFGYVKGTQCQIVDGAGVGKLELVKRGIISAVDVWGFVNGGVEVCFRNSGALLFLDAAYAPRMLMELEAYQRDGMTCGAINGAGTVVLVRADRPPDLGAPPPGEPTLPTIDSLPPKDCHIKLQETLFLRATPAGEIIGLVWLYSEVPVFEVNGEWYRVEFEGRVGFISRHHRKVLRGGCG